MAFKIREGVQMSVFSDKTLGKQLLMSKRYLKTVFKGPKVAPDDLEAVLWSKTCFSCLESCFGSLKVAFNGLKRVYDL